MASAKYLAQLANFSRVPTTLVRITLPGTITGNQVFRFSPKKGAPLNLQLGEDVRTYLDKDPKGRPTKIRPDLSVTERARMSIVMFDDPNAPVFDSTVFTVFQGGSFWRRFIVAQPDYVGAKCEVLWGFVADGFDEADFEPIFVGRIEDIDFNNDGKVVIIAKDNLRIVDDQFPAEISDSNLISAAILDTDTTFTVANAEEVPDPSKLPTLDYFQTLLRIDEGNKDINGQPIEEDLIVKDVDVPTNTITVQDNYADKSEEFDDGLIWIVSGATVTANTAVGPFGGNAFGETLATISSGDGITQTTLLTAANQTVTFSVWLKGTTTGDIVLDVRSSAATVESAQTTASVTTDWQRFEVSITFTGAAGGTVEIAIEETGTAPPTILLVPSSVNARRL